MAEDRASDLRRHISQRVQELAPHCTPDGPSLVVTESITGGMFCAALVAEPDVSGALERGFIVYSTDAKCDILDLDRGPVEKCEGVGRQITIDLAEAALKRSRADISIATTGFAGPQEDDEEVGLTYVAIARKAGATIDREFHFGDIGREAVCERAVIAGLDMLLECFEDRA